MTGIHLILEAEKSSELVTAFRLLREAEDKGQPRFPVDAVRAVERAIACRTYASALLELCHLVRAASPYRDGYVELFWAPGPLRSRRFKELFASCRPATWLRVDGTSVDLTYPDGRFSIAYSRMPFLVAMAEFVVTVLGFADMDAIFGPLCARAVSQAQVSQQANALSRAIYEYLKLHLPTVQAQKKLQAVIEFLSARGGGDFDAATIDDQAVLEFWQAAIDDGEAKDFRTFASAFLAFARLWQVLQHADTIGALEHALPIGSSVEAGEVDPADIASVVDTVGRDANPLDELQAPPCARVKFFNAQEREGLSLLFQCGRAADAFPLSLVRCEVFGPLQARLSQSLRTDRQVDALRRLIAAGPDDDYAAHQDRLRSLLAHGRTVLLAAAHVMYSGGFPQIADLARTLRPGLEVAAETVVPLQPARGAAVAVEPRPDPEVDAFLAEARKAARRIARQGFRTDEIKDDEVRAGFVAGCPLVAAVVERLEDFLDRLGRLRLTAGTWEAQFDSDAALFNACFARIYGAAP